MDYGSAMIKLYKIFKDKSWTQKDRDEFVFNNFCQLFGNLEPQERELVLELTERYIWISAEEYGGHLSSAIESIPQSELQGVKEVLLFPIIKPGDEDKYKSGDHLIYPIKSNKIYYSNFKGIKFRYIKKFEEFDGLQLTTGLQKLFLIDDFIGSGDTLSQCLNEIGNRASIDNTDVKVICISSQKEAYDKFGEMGIQFFSQFIINRGISDYNTNPELDQKKSLMKRIEKSIPGSKSFSLGWNESEATITMMRTPDNTFPVFWKNYKKKTGDLIEAPFSREEIND